MRSEDSRRRSQGAAENKHHRQNSLSLTVAINFGQEREKEERFTLLSLFWELRPTQRPCIFLPADKSAGGVVAARKKNRALTNYDAHQTRVSGKYNFAQACSF
jgi:hypothetical protein